MNVLVAAASQFGATAEIAQAIADELARGDGLDVTVTRVEEVEGIDDYDAVVLGSAVYTGHWLAPARELVERAGDALARRPVWLFSSGPVGDPSRKLVQRMGADPVELPAVRERTNAREHRMFAGKLERKNLSAPQRAALALFRGLDGDFRDWREIRAWAGSIRDDLDPKGIR